MKKLILTFIALTSLTSMAMAGERSSVSCENAVTQIELNECSSIQAQNSLTALKNKIISSCKEQEEIRNAARSSIYPLLLNSCVEEKANALIKKIR